MSRRAKVLLIGIPLLLFVAGMGWLVKVLFFQGEPGPDDVEGWRRYERLEITAHPVEEKPTKGLMIHGINFGFQFSAPFNARDRGDPKRDESRLPTSYYHRYSPIGVIMERWNWATTVNNRNGPGHANSYWVWQHNTYHADARLPTSMVGLVLGDGIGGTHLSGMTALVQSWSEPPIAIVGIMGPGTMAAYARPYQTIDFYEPSPAIIEMSAPKTGKAPKFTFLQDAKDRGANVRIFQGPARQTFAEKAPTDFYSVIVIEPSRINDVPVTPLLTVEAMDLFRRAGRHDVVLCYHASNRFYDLARITVVAARDRKAAFAVGRFGHITMERTHEYTCDWVMVGWDTESFQSSLKDPVIRGKTYDALVRATAARLPAEADAARVRPFWDQRQLSGTPLRDGDTSALPDYRRNVR